MSLADDREAHTALRAVCTLGSRTPGALGPLFPSQEAHGGGEILRHLVTCGEPGLEGGLQWVSF